MQTLPSLSYPTPGVIVESSGYKVNEIGIVNEKE
jgi:hypothetical protein